MDKLIKSIIFLFGVLPAFGWLIILAYSIFGHWGTIVEGFHLIYIFLFLCSTIGTIGFFGSIFYNFKTEFELKIATIMISIGIVTMLVVFVVFFKILESAFLFIIVPFIFALLSIVYIYDKPLSITRVSN